MDPDPAAPAVGVRVVGLRHVGVEEAGAAAVERVRVGRHLAVLPPEALGIGLHQRGEGVVEGGDDQVLAFVGRGHGGQCARGQVVRAGAVEPVRAQLQVGQPRDHGPVPLPQGRHRVVADAGQDVQGLRDDRAQREDLEVGGTVHEALRGTRVADEPGPPRQVEHADHQDRDQRDRQSQPEREPLDRADLRAAGVGEGRGGLRGLVERRGRPVTDDRQVAQRVAGAPHGVRQPGRRGDDLVSGPGQVHGAVVHHVPDPDPGEDPADEQHVADELGGEPGGDVGVQLHASSDHPAAGASRLGTRAHPDGWAVEYPHASQGRRRRRGWAS